MYDSNGRGIFFRRPNNLPFFPWGSLKLSAFFFSFFRRDALKELRFFSWTIPAKWADVRRLFGISRNSGKTPWNVRPKMKDFSRKSAKYYIKSLNYGHSPKVCENYTKNCRLEFGDLEKYANSVHQENGWKMNIWLKKSASMQSRTDLPEFGLLSYPDHPLGQRSSHAGLILKRAAEVEVVPARDAVIIPGRESSAKIKWPRAD